MRYSVSERLIRDFEQSLICEERSRGTIEKYMRDIEAFLKFTGKDLAVGSVSEWKRDLIQKNYAVSTINSMLTAVNRLLKFAGWEECRGKRLKQQRAIFCDESRELSREEYMRLLRTAQKQGKQRICLVMQTICSTGIRISELKYITAESLSSGRTKVACKGKCRVVFLPGQLRKLLKTYCRREGIRTGPVFVTKSGTALDRSNIWREMKKLCESAGVSERKVFPHNLRHLFARMFYRMEKDLAKLADLLGHSSVETTRIYLMESGWEHEKKIGKLRLLL